jgi:hypothetical protein
MTGVGSQRHKKKKLYSLQHKNVRVCTVQQHARRSAPFPLNTTPRPSKFHIVVSKCVVARLLNFSAHETRLYVSLHHCSRTRCLPALCVAFLFLLDTLVPKLILSMTPRGNFATLRKSLGIIFPLGDHSHEPQSKISVPCKLIRELYYTKYTHCISRTSALKFLCP